MYLVLEAVLLIPRYSSHSKDNIKNTN